jgi:uncharacterized protein YqfB (UPF0267 family)
MTPDHSTTLSLDELNAVIAEQKGVSIADLALTPTVTADVQRVAKEKADKAAAIKALEPIGDDDPVVVAMKAANNTTVSDPVVVAAVTPLTSEELAVQLLRQADVMLNEAKALQAKAQELMPAPKKITARRKPAVKKKESV